MKRPIKDFIPDLRPLYEAVRDLVAFAQGEKGYIDTQDLSCDFLYAVEYSEERRQGVETRIHGVRVRDGELEILTHEDVGSVHVVYGDEDFSDPEAEWERVRDSDIVYFIPTLFNIAEDIEEYIPADILDKYYREEITV